MMDKKTNQKVDISLNHEEFYKRYGRKKNVSLFTLGCKVNQYETEAIMEQFISKGYQIVDFGEEAEVCVINTCSVTNMADKKSRKALAKVRNQGKGLVVAVGCYVQVSYQKLEQDQLADILIGTKYKNKVCQIVEDYWRELRQAQQDLKRLERDLELLQQDLELPQQNYVADIRHKPEYESLMIDHQQSRTRSTIKIQDGCNQFCNYCIIPYTRGSIRSRQMSDILTEVEHLVANGYREIVLTGIHLASYGLDLREYGLIELIEVLNQIKGLERIRLGSLEVNLINPDFIRRLAACHKVCDHFHLSLQSGSDTTLQRMNRRYTSGQYLEKVELIRQYYAQPAITTDIIVGFPMESSAEFEETYRFAANIGFADAHIFKYSRRDGTKAASMPQIAGSIKNQRSKRLEVLQKQLKQDYIEQLIEVQASNRTSANVLFEQQVVIDSIGYYVGYTTNYIKVYVCRTEQAQSADWETTMHNRVLPVWLQRPFQDGVLGATSQA